MSEGLGLALGEERHLPWSYSRADTAKTCLAKFEKIYICGERETSPALTLGSLAHSTMEALLKDKTKPTIEKAENYLCEAQTEYENKEATGDEDVTAAVLEVEKLLPYMVDFVTKFKGFLSEKHIKHWAIEHPYGLQENLKRAQYEPGIYRTYLRGRIDLWAYDAENETLYVIDHKTNKSVDSPKKVKENIQLNLYITFLTNVYHLKWKKAYFGLNFLRRGKVVWSSTTPEENEVFTQTYMNTLHYLEAHLMEAELDGYYPPEENYKCYMCTFKDTCPAHNTKINSEGA